MSQNYFTSVQYKNWLLARRKRDAITYKLYFLLTKQNIFITFTKANGNVIKTWTLASFLIDKILFKSRGQLKRLGLIISQYLKQYFESKDYFLFIKLSHFNRRLLSLVRYSVKKKSIRKIDLFYNTPHNGCRLPKRSRK